MTALNLCFAALVFFGGLEFECATGAAAPDLSFAEIRSTILTASVFDL